MSNEERDAFMDSGGCEQFRNAIRARNPQSRPIRRDSKTPRGVKNDKAA